MRKNSTWKFPALLATIAITAITHLPRTASADLIETINLTDVDLLSPESGSNFSPFEWRMGIPILTTAFNAGDMLEITIDFDDQAMQVSGREGLGVLPSLSVFPTEDFDNNTNLYDVEVTFTGVGGDLAQDSVMVEVQTFNNGLAHQFFDLTDSFFTFQGVHYLLTAEQAFTPSASGANPLIRGADMQVVNVPEPATFALFAIGMLGLACRGPRRRSSNREE